MTGRMRPRTCQTPAMGVQISLICRCGWCSRLVWPVDVRAVLNGHHLDAAAASVDAVDHPVVATAGTVQALQPELEWLAHLLVAPGRQPGAPVSGLRMRDGACRERQCGPGSPAWP